MFETAARLLTINRLMGDTVQYLKHGHIQPSNHAGYFDASSLKDAFTRTESSQEAATVCIRIRDDDGQLLIKDKVNSPRELRLDSHGSYLLVGGLGGLGRAISTYLLDHGARSLIYLGRCAAAEYCSGRRQLLQVGQGAVGLQPGSKGRRNLEFASCH